MFNGQIPNLKEWLSLGESDRNDIECDTMKPWSVSETFHFFRKKNVNQIWQNVKTSQS